MKFLNFEDPSLIQLIKEGFVGILPTDTIYGIHASALIPEAIEKMYQIRLRDLNKPFIVLVSDTSQLNQFGVSLTEEQKTITNDLWNKSVSIILPISNPNLNYLTRGTGSVAFRIPLHDKLRELVTNTGPLVSTSVNKQGERPAETIKEAEEVFGDTLDFAVDEGPKTSEPSTVVELVDNKVRIIRQGKTEIPQEFLLE